MVDELLNELENLIKEIEGKIENDEDFILEDEFQTLNEKLLRNQLELHDFLNDYFSKDLNENQENEISKKSFVFKKMEKRIAKIQSKLDSNDDEWMFPNGKDED